MEKSAPAPTQPHESSLAKNRVLKACIFATGLSGIVAEYVMSTLASYLLGNAILQWTITISLMLFSMGLGSRFSKSIQNALLDSFIIIELILSLICASSAIFIYFMSAYVQSIDFFIYLVALTVGFLIGIEVPLATRLNSYFEDLRYNISSVMENDYYGALLGGLLFAFVALPWLGLTYTPILLGLINFLVATVLFFQHRAVLKFSRGLTIAFSLTPLAFVALFWAARPIILFADQKTYSDKIIFSQETPYQKILMTQWKDDFWLYLNDNTQFSSYDEEKYHEPLVHPALKLAHARKNILLLGGGDGMAAREIFKYQDVASITIVDIDPAVTRLAKEHPLFIQQNQGVFNDSRLHVRNEDAYTFLRESKEIFDVILIDLPDPKTVDLARLYTRQFYTLAYKHLSVGGTLVTQATSPFFAQKAFLSIMLTMRSTGYPAVPFHNHIPTMGEWAWVLGYKHKETTDEALKKRIIALDFTDIKTKFINADAMLGMTLFGKGMFDNSGEIRINDEFNLTLYEYYKNGSWDLF